MAERPGSECTDEVAKNTEKNGRTKTQAYTHRDDVGDGVLKTTEDKEGNAEQDTEFGVSAVELNSEIHDDTAEGGFDEKTKREGPAFNFGLGGRDD